MPCRLSSILVLGGVALLAACSGSMQGSGQSSLSPAVAQTGSFSSLERTGVTPTLFAGLSVRRPAAGVRPRAAAKAPKDLFVTDRDLGEVIVFANKTWQNSGKISDGTLNGDGDYVDKKGNLYVADTSGAIEEYAPGADSPSFTYNASMKDAINVSVDSKGNVYEADYQGGFVNEYAQASNTVTNSCSPGGGVEGIAVDASGDVFVDYNGNGGGRIAEYKGGLNGCSETVLDPTFKFVGGMVLDKHRNLLICDQQNAAVDVVAPPYSSITGELGSGFITPLHVTLDKTNKLAFVTDIGNTTVYSVVDVLDYPSGKVVTQLGTAAGLEDPWGAADAPNAVY
jgi:hypothetical protein